MIEKLLLIIAYQLQRTARRNLCPMCWLINDHEKDCELKELETWVQGEMLSMMKKQQEAK